MKTGYSIDIWNTTVQFTRWNNIKDMTLYTKANDHDIIFLNETNQSQYDNNSKINSERNMEDTLYFIEETQQHIDNKKEYQYYSIDSPVDICKVLSQQDTIDECST